MPESNFIDKSTARLSGFDYCLQGIRPHSAYGRRAKKALRPFLPGSESELRAHFALQGRLLELLIADDAPFLTLEHQLGEMPDWQRPLASLEQGISLADADFLGLKQLLYWQGAMQDTLRLLPEDLAPAAINTDFSPLWDLLDPEGRGTPSFYLADSYSPHLAALRRKRRQVRQDLHSLSTEADARMAAHLGREQLPGGEFRLAKHDIAAQRALEEAPLLSLSRSTYTDNFYRRLPGAEEEALAAELALLEEQISIESGAVRERLTNEIRPYAGAIKELCHALGFLDLLLAQVRWAAEISGSVPQVFDRAPEEPLRLAFTDARHPQVAENLAAEGLPFQNLSWQLASGATVLSGANMGGKSVALRLAALLVALAQHGLLVPAEGFSFTLFSGLRLLAEDAAGAEPGLSRFGNQIHGINNVLPLQAAPWLLLYDEPAGGTNPAEGAALVQALVEAAREELAMSVFVTHYAGPTHVSGAAHWQVAGLLPEARRRLREAKFGQPFYPDWPNLIDYSLRPVSPGQAPPREALEVAELLGLPAAIVARARVLLESESPSSKPIR